jgi:hypothetical protein
VNEIALTPSHGRRRWRWTRRLFATGLGAATLGLGATAALAASNDPELVDMSHQVQDIQKKVSELQAQGRWARDGVLRAAATCGDEQTARVFQPWGDLADYALAPQGDLEAADGWTLDHQARVAAGNEPFAPGGQSLLLPDGGTAVSPVICVSLAHPTIRFFAQNTGDPNARLEVEVVYQDLNGKPQHMTVAKLKGSSSWSPTTIVPFYANLLAAASPDGMTAVAFRFTAKDLRSKASAWRVDDLYVDPFKGK